MRILTFTTLYPNSIQPHFGVFVENRLRHLVSEGSVEARVIAPVPWFPWRGKAFGRYSIMARVPAEERRFGITVLHPRYPLIPKIGMITAPFLIYAAIRSVAAELMESGYDFDLIDAHYFFPDGVAAAMLGKRLGRPVTITARGTDINLISRYRVPRRLIRWAADNVAGVVAVCEALKDEIVRIGVDSSRVLVLRNGVDLDTFKPIDRTIARRKLGLREPVLLSVGHLIPRKGHDLVIRALLEILKASLLIVGEGPMEASLKRLTDSLGLAQRVRFLGPVAHERMHEVYSAADVLVLASDREGWPNVLLEAMASGTPVAATNVWGAPEVVASRAAGVLISDRNPGAIACAVRNLLANPPVRTETRAYAERFSWDETTRGQLELFRSIVERRTA